MDEKPQQDDDNENQLPQDFKIGTGDETLDIEKEPETGTAIKVNVNNTETLSDPDELPMEVPQAFIPPVLPSEQPSDIKLDTEPVIETVIPPAAVATEPIVTQTEPVKPVHSTGAIVLQWLTYAFWFLTVVAMSFLTTVTLSFYVNGTNVGDSALYSIAAILVLLPISVICDIFYMKKEPETKTGAASVVAIIHSVIFALFGIGSLITAIFSLVTLFINGSDSDGTLVTLYSSLTIAFLFAVIFLRTILPKRITWFRRLFIIIMVIIVGLITTFGIIGPTMDARLRRNDTLLESNLSTVSSSIESYVYDNSKLPDTLGSLTLTGGAKKIVTDKLVAYTKIGQPKTDTDLETTTYYYKLCVTYKKASNNAVYGGSSSVSSDESDGYSTYISNYTHPAGDVCYKLKTTSYSDGSGGKIVPLEESTN